MVWNGRYRYTQGPSIKEAHSGGLHRAKEAPTLNSRAGRRGGVGGVGRPIQRTSLNINLPSLPPIHPKVNFAWDARQPLENDCSSLCCSPNQLARPTLKSPPFLRDPQRRRRRRRKVFFLMREEKKLLKLFSSSYSPSLSPIKFFECLLPPGDSKKKKPQTPTYARHSTVAMPTNLEKHCNLSAHPRTHAAIAKSEGPFRLPDSATQYQSHDNLIAFYNLDFLKTKSPPSSLPGIPYPDLVLRGPIFLPIIIKSAQTVKLLISHGFVTLGKRTLSRMSITTKAKMARPKSNPYTSYRNLL